MPGILYFHFLRTQFNLTIEVTTISCYLLVLGKCVSSYFFEERGHLPKFECYSKMKLLGVKNLILITDHSVLPLGVAGIKSLCT